MRLLALAERILLARPYDIDTRLYYGAVLSWEGRYEEARTQLERDPHPLPTMTLRRTPPSIFEYQYEDFELLDYTCEPAIKAPIAV